MTSNMELWNQVCETNPDMTKRVNRRGGFTAICAQAQAKRATELWGAYGKNWGLKNCRFGYVNGETGTPVNIWLEAVLFYPGGEFEVSSDMPFVANDECRKKLMTECRSKALSLLGFNSDVFEGRFDDNRYVAEMRAKFGGSMPATPATVEISGFPKVSTSPVAPPRQYSMAPPTTQPRFQSPTFRQQQSPPLSAAQYQPQTKR